MSKITAYAPLTAPQANDVLVIVDVNEPPPGTNQTAVPPDGLWTED